MVISLSFPLLLGPLDDGALPTTGKPSSEEQKQALQISFSGISAVSVHSSYAWEWSGIRKYKKYSKKISFVGSSLTVCMG